MLKQVNINTEAEASAAHHAQTNQDFHVKWPSDNTLSFTLYAGTTFYERNKPHTYKCCL